MSLIFRSLTLSTIVALLAHAPIGAETGKGEAVEQKTTSAAQELLPNPSLSLNDQGWYLREASVVPNLNQNTASTVLLKGVPAGPNKWSHIGVSLTSAPIDHKLNFSCLLRGSDANQKVMVNAFAYDDQKKLVTSWTRSQQVQTSDWSHFNSSYVLPQQVKQLAIWVVNPSGKDAFMSQPSLICGDYEKAPTIAAKSPTSDGPAKEATTVILARYKACVKAGRGETGDVTFPIPGTYREQVPLTFDVSAQPASALQSYRIYPREDGRNWLCEVTVKPPQEGAIITWESLVLVSGRTEPTLPKESASAPADVAQWTRSTKCVQSNDPQIRKKADELAAGTQDVETYARKVIQFTSANEGTGQEFNALDAKTALGCGGSCTSRANLAAALLRAKGIPARTVSHLPAWYNGDFFEHWLVEYWHPTVGWVWLESTLGKFQPAPNDLVVLAESTADDEDKAEDPVHLRYIMHGAAYLSGCELSPELFPAYILPNASHANAALAQGEISGSAADLKKLFDTAGLNFNNKITAQTGLSSQSSVHTAKIQAAVKSSKANELTSALEH